jgi:hypothetical protein
MRATTSRRGSLLGPSPIEHTIDARTRERSRLARAARSFGPARRDGAPAVGSLLRTTGGRYAASHPLEQLTPRLVARLRLALRRAAPSQARRSQQDRARSPVRDHALTGSRNRSKRSSLSIASSGTARSPRRAAKAHRGDNTPYPLGGGGDDMPYPGRRQRRHAALLSDAWTISTATVIGGATYATRSNTRARAGTTAAATCRPVPSDTDRYVVPSPATRIDMSSRPQRHGDDVASRAQRWVPTNVPAAVIGGAKAMRRVRTRAPSPWRSARSRSRSTHACASPRRAATSSADTRPAGRTRRGSA